MAQCKTCGKSIRVPAGWTVGPAVRRHYWAKHPEVMERGRADRAAVSSIASRKPKPGTRRPQGRSAK